VLASGKDRNSASKIRDSNCNSILMNNNTLNIGVIKLFHSGGDMQSHIQALEGHSCEKAGVARSWCGEQPRGPCAAMPTQPTMAATWQLSIQFDLLPPSRLPDLFLTARHF
jgi:hypothetical protein